jgi:uncharacterized membrane protein HdeD (DUF308 family)
MLIVYRHSWWTLALRGLVAVIFGLLTFILPGITLTTLVLLFGAYVLVDGVFAIAAGLKARESKRWWVLLIEGVLGVIAGVLTFLMPGMTALFLLGLVAAWAMLTGVTEIVAAIQMRKYITNEWLLALSGVASLLFGVLLLINPGIGLLTLVWFIGAYVMVFGILLLALAFRLRGLERSTQRMSPKPA